MLQLRHMTEVSTKNIDQILSRGVGEFIDPDNNFKNKLLAKTQGKYSKDIIIKFGIDPTRPDIHLGHAVVFRKLRQLQGLGCKVIFLVGDFTAQIGDPSGKNKSRPELELQEIGRNVKTFLEQIHKIIDTTDENLFSWIKNSDWLFSVEDIIGEGLIKKTITNDKGEKLELELDGKTFLGKAVLFEKTRMQVNVSHSGDVVGVTVANLLSNLRKITLSQLIERDMFKHRLENGKELFMHEMLYPVLQGIDSSVLNNIYGSCDLEIGGTDQTFNMLMGRTVMKNSNQEPQSVLSLKILEGLDGKEKMSKSLDNYVSIVDPANEMYGKIMSIPDTSILNYFELCTYVPTEDLGKIKDFLSDRNNNPKEVKMRLAREIVAIYHGEDQAKQAEQNFITTFQNKELPAEIPEVKARVGEKVADILVAHKIVESKTDWRRLVEAGAVTDLVTNESIADSNLELKSPLTLKVGKRRFVKILL